MTTSTADPLVNRLIDHGRVRWKSLVVFALVGGVVGAAASYLVTPAFESSAAFQAEPTSNYQLQGSLAGLASQLGGLPLGGGTVNAQFFADILPSDAVLGRVITDTFPYKGERATLEQVYRVTDKPSPLKEYILVNRLRRAISSMVNNRTNMVRFTVEAPSADLAKALAEDLVIALNEVNVELRQARASAEQSFTSERAEASRRELASAEEALTRFYQRNRSITGAPALATEERRLVRNVDMAQQVFTQLRIQQEQAAVQAVRNTPAISVVDPPMLPVRKSKPKRKVAALLGMFVGLCLGGLRLALEPNRPSGEEPR
jgi:uncharacterized protein involved in exopolysaccharide biosynthesis